MVNSLKIIEFTFAFTSLSFACAGVSFAPQALALLRCSLAASSPCRFSPVALQRSSRTVLQFCCYANRQPNNPVLTQVAIHTLYRTIPSNSQVPLAFRASQDNQKHSDQCVSGDM